VRVGKPPPPSLLLFHLLFALKSFQELLSSSVGMDEWTEAGGWLLEHKLDEAAREAEWGLGL
jgi:hypothetical protein